MCMKYYITISVRLLIIKFSDAHVVYHTITALNTVESFNLLIGTRKLLLVHITTI